MSCARYLVKTPYSLHFPTTTRRIICRMFALLLALPCWVILLWGFPTAHSMRLSRPWTEKHWCESVVEPEWPFAYEKFPGNEFERKGRTNSNRQDMRHECNTYGVESKCHICEDIETGRNTNNTIHYQLQGVAWENMSINLPSATDQPFAVGGHHRFDFGSVNTTEVCVFLSAKEDCISPPPTGETRDYSDCSLRCWGYGYRGDENTPDEDHLESRYYTYGEDNGDTYRTKDGDSWVATDVWNYQKTQEPGVAADQNKRAEVSVYGSDVVKDQLAFNPQGFVYTFAGKVDLITNDEGDVEFGDNYGFQNGPSEEAMFRGPQDVAVDREKNVFVADTGNNCIRRVDKDGDVTTVAGQCGEENIGSDDGSSNDAKFARPSGITVHYSSTKVYDNIALGALVLFVADTDNHRIRRIDCIQGVSEKYRTPDCDTTVTCWAGRCGNGTFSYTLTKMKASVAPGLADGPGAVARFDSPRGIEADDEGVVFVADTNNHLIRGINQSGWVFTLAGKIAVQEADEYGRPVPGCPPPCIKGVPGWEDGPLTDAQFYYPADVTIGGEWTLLVSDKMRLRRITFPQDYYKLFWEDNRGPHVTQIDSTYGLVSTVAGQRYAGVRDGPGPNAEFMDPEAVSMGKDGIIFMLDSGTCRLRRLIPGMEVAESLTCDTKGIEVIRPSGCTSYDPPVDSRDVMASAVQGNIYYNYYDRLDYDAMDGSEPRGRSIKDCTGSPPPYLYDKRNWQTGQNLAIDDGVLGIDEDANDGMRITVRCPLTCGRTSSGGPVYGGGVTIENTNGNGTMRIYSDESSICMAAEHAGVISEEEFGLITVYIEKGTLSYNEDNLEGSVRNGVNSSSIPYGHPRLLQVGSARARDLLVSSIAGRPAALLESPCGYADGQPMQQAMFNIPQGMGMYVNGSLSEETVLFIADTKNNLIRAVSAGCGQICENGGRCVAADTCECQEGWLGHDCTRPVCSNDVPPNMICVAPDITACIPGYGGQDCTTALCVQECANGGVCTFPDTCECPYGWWDANCTTPVCSQTCGNGGNCTGPDTCSCPEIWKGPDCRQPVCVQTCKNGGQCIAPDTCLCPPQWSGHDCTLPVCHQGFFETTDEEIRSNVVRDPLNKNRSPYPNTALNADLKNSAPRFWAMYRPCFYELYCSATNEFDCRQPYREFYPIEPASEEKFAGARIITGRKIRPMRCTTIELGEDVITNLQYFQARNKDPNNEDPVTGYARYTPKTPYYWNATPPHPWTSVDRPTNGRTPPFYHMSDRQVAAVEWHNVTQGVYVCANEGKCIAPDQCQCAPGWMGFDCRTPICSQGYHIPTQERYVSGTKHARELDYFEPFMSQISTSNEEGESIDMTDLRLQWEYSNPNYTMHWEYFVNKTHRAAEVRHHGNERYLSRVGSNVWANQEGTILRDELEAIDCDSQDNTLFGGHTLGNLAAKNKGKGYHDVFFGVYNKKGDREFLWQNGTINEDKLYGGRYDSTDRIVIGGITEGSFDGEKHGEGDRAFAETGSGVDSKLNYDIWVGKWERKTSQTTLQDGSTEESVTYEELWRKQFGSASIETSDTGDVTTYAQDYLNVLETDFENNIIIGGSTNGDFCGQRSSGLSSGTCRAMKCGTDNCDGYNAWIAKLDPNGNELWSLTFGSNKYDTITAIAIDSTGNIYVAGTTDDVLEGATAEDYRNPEIDDDTGNLKNKGNLNTDNKDIFIAKFSKTNQRLGENDKWEWLFALGSAGIDHVQDIEVNSRGEVFFAGATTQDLGVEDGFGTYDIFFGKLDTNGKLIEYRDDGSRIGGYRSDDGVDHYAGIIQLGTEVIDYATAITIDSKDNVIIAGYTGGDFINVNAGPPPTEDVWYAKYDRELNQLFIDQFGTDGQDIIRDMTYYKSQNEFMTDNAIMGGISDGRYGPVHTGNSDFWVVNYTFMTFQGGYQCSVRSVTQWERVGPPHLYPYILSHPNYFSGYMDPKVENDGIQYSNWTGMQWPAIHAKTAPLYISEDIVDAQMRKIWNVPGEPASIAGYTNTPNMYVYTNEGHRLDGIWEVTGEGWVKGTCVIEFERVCEHGDAPKDLYTGLSGVRTQDPDLSYRPRITYGQFNVSGEGRFFESERGECVDHVIRGCFNNGTCVAPDQCACAPGWGGVDCSEPICPTECNHNGNCTLPNTCTCELGWSGEDCNTPVCAQDCLNSGTCVAPDTCKCLTWPMSFYDTNVPPQPLYQKPESFDVAIEGGEPQLTGYTGFDCSVPICVQANSWEFEGGGGFYRNIEDFPRDIKYVLPLSEYIPPGYREGAGRGPDGMAECAEVRCPFFDEMVINNLGQSFQGGCGFDPLFGTQIGYGHVGGGVSGGDIFADGDTDETIGCCLEVQSSDGKKYLCRRCIGEQIEQYNNYTCVMDGDYVVLGSTFTNYKRSILDMALQALPTCIGCLGENDVDCENGEKGVTCAVDLQQKADSLVDSCNDMKPFCSVETDPDNPNYPGFVMENINSYSQVNTRTFRLCGPTGFVPTPRQELKQRPFVIELLRGIPLRNKTSNDFLCSVREWEQGDYIDDGDLNERFVPLTGVGIEYDTRETSIGTTAACQLDGFCDSRGYRWDTNNPNNNVGNRRPCCQGFPARRHIRTNYANITKNPISGKWEYQDTVPGEGVFFCPKGGSCVAPDECTCADGYAGFACNIPLCRHLQKIDSTGQSYVSSCLNGGICASRDDCHCIQTKSLMYTKYPDSPAGLTGYTGADCSMPICVQGFYDPYCTNLPEAPGGEGCFRCANGGNCTAPDTCTCAEGWTGYDCKTPICEVVSNALQRSQLNTVDEEKIAIFERDPCALFDETPLIDESEEGYLDQPFIWYTPEPWFFGSMPIELKRGNCTMPNVCTCLCKIRYSFTLCNHPNKGQASDEKKNMYCRGPFQDDLVGERNILAGDELFGTRECFSGYEGVVDEYDRFMSCHMKIKEPNGALEEHAVLLLVICSILGFVSIVSYVFLRRRLKQIARRRKEQRRKSRRSSEESITK